MNRITTLSLGCAALAACTTTPPPFDEDGNPRTREPVQTCDARGVQDSIGRRASAGVGADLLRATGARQLRWVPPHTVVTADYRPGRLTVAYDESYIIERISCG